MTKNSIIVVGAGPSGMMAAIKAAKAGAKVLLFEKNSSPGKKLLLTGNGRCNITNAISIDEFYQKFGKNGPFLRDAFKAFSNIDLIRFFEKRGLKFTTEDAGRVFPSDNKASSVLNVLKNELERGGAQVNCGQSISEIIVSEGAVGGVLTQEGKEMISGSVILATGGLSYQVTGSTGGGYKMAKKIGHTVIEPKPGLVPLCVEEKYISRLKGLSLSGVQIKIRAGKSKFISEPGDIIFTDNGISGPLVIAISSQVLRLLEQKTEVSASIDLSGGVNPKKIASRLTAYIEENPRRAIKNTLGLLLPERMADLFLSVSQIDPEKHANQVTSKERANLAGLYKNFSLTIAGSWPIDTAMITRGGISLKEINPKTMESRLVKGLYFAGEIIDLDATTGGFNLQEAFSTGFLAGKSTAEQ